MTVFLGLGSNLDVPEVQIKRALARIQELVPLQHFRCSSLVETPPMAGMNQPDYVNAVAGLLTRKSPEELLALMQSLEQRLGRVRIDGDRWGPRIIDLDLLVYGLTQMSVPGLNLPHPGISERNFVLFPLRDIAPKLIVLGQGDVGILAQQVGAAGLQRIEQTIEQ